MIALAASSVIVEPLSDPKRAWAFKMPQNDSLMATAMVQDMKKGLKNVAFIGFADSYGDSWWKEFSAAAGADLKIVAQEPSSASPIPMATAGGRNSAPPPAPT